jgi:GNAT superfamily N-acetyltransferase
MFANAALAARLDRAEAALGSRMARVVGDRHPDLGSFVMPVAGGAAVYAGPGSPMNKLIGAAFDDVPEERELAAIEAAYAERGSPFQAEVSSLANPELVKLLLRRGYQLQGYENLLGRALRPDEPLEPSHVTVEPCTEPEAVTSWIEMLADAFTAPDVGGVGGDVTPPREAILRWGHLSAATPGLGCYLARVDEAPAGGGSLFVGDRVAVLCGAGTLPAFRRRGVQTVLLRARLAHAALQGCDVATVTTQPGSKSQQNVQREGFSLLYMRALLVKEP